MGLLRLGNWLYLIQLCILFYHDFAAYFARKPSVIADIFGDRKVINCENAVHCFL